MKNLASSLIVGKKYVFSVRTRVEGCMETVNKKMKLVGKYPHIAVFENDSGYAEAYTYWDLERIVNAPSIKSNICY